jgi:hypothetical protein
LSGNGDCLIRERARPSAVCDTEPRGEKRDAQQQLGEIAAIVHQLGGGLDLTVIMRLTARISVGVHSIYEVEQEAKSADDVRFKKNAKVSEQQARETVTDLYPGMIKEASTKSKATAMQLTRSMSLMFRNSHQTPALLVPIF